MPVCLSLLQSLAEQHRQHFAGCLNTSLRGCLRRTLDGLDYWLTLGLTAGKPGMEESWKTGDLMSWRIKVGWHYLIQLLAVPSPIKFETQITKNAAELRINLLKFTLLWSMKFHSYLKVINQSTSIFTRLKPHETTTSSIFLCYKLASCFQNKVKVSLGGGTYRLAILDKAHGVQDNPIPMMAKWREATNSMMNLPFRAGRKVGTSIIDETQSYPK